MSVESLTALAQIQGTFALLAPATTAPKGSQDMFARLLAALQAESTTTSAPSGPTGASILTAAESYEGVPYVFGGTSRDGIDCTGLAQLALRDAGIEVGRSMDAQMTAGTEVGALADAKPGDLIVLDGGAHIVIYAGNGEVVHAPYEGRTVTRQKAWFDDSDIVTIRRVAPEATATVAPLSASTSTGFSEALQSLINAQAAILSRSIS